MTKTEREKHFITPNHSIRLQNAKAKLKDEQIAIYKPSKTRKIVVVKRG